MAGTPRAARRSGMTLIEVLVAIAVFSLMAVVGYGALRETLEARARVQAALRDLASLQRAFAALERDLGQAVARPVRDRRGALQPAILSAPGAAGTVLELTRTGWPNPARVARSALQRVAYRWEGRRLVRLATPALDGLVPPGEGGGRTLVDGVDAVSLRFLDSADRWHGQWPAAPATPAALVAVEVVLELRGWGRLTRLLTVSPGASG